MAINPVGKILQVVESFTPKEIKLSKLIEGYNVTTEIYKCQVNIVYILDNKVYVGEGYMRDTLYNLKKGLARTSCDGVIFEYKPKLVCTLEKGEVDSFKKLLKHEKQVFGNVKITSSYKDWIKNELPYRLAVTNEEVYYPYEVRGINLYVNCNHYWKGAIVSVCFDNCDIEVHQDYYIRDDNPFASGLVTDLKRGDWAEYCGLIDTKIDHRTIQI